MTAVPPGGTYRVQCGWCGHVAEPPKCGYCGRDPLQPWAQRGQEAPVAAPEASGRPSLDVDEIRRLYHEARSEVIASGKPPTVQAIADQLDRSARTVRAWRQRFDLE